MILVEDQQIGRYEARWNNIKILVNPLRGLRFHGGMFLSTIILPLRGKIMSRFLTKSLGGRAQMVIKHRRCLILVVNIISPFS